MSKSREIDFESALERLESLVVAMEEGDVPLAELIEKFEEGNKLLKICQRKLRDAELKIEMLKADGDSEDTEAFRLEGDS